MKYNIAKNMLAATVRKVMGKRKTVALAAVDATGFENGHISPYFFKQSSPSRKPHKSSKFTKWPKMAVLADTDNHLIFAVAEDRGPGRDATHFEKLLLRIPESIRVKALVADAGYDSEKNHKLARETYGIVSIISPLSGRKAKTNKLPKGKYRRIMKTRFDKKRYGQRWQVETVYSMIKRNLTDSLSSKSYWAQCREMLLLAITHNFLILLLAKELFYRAKNL